MLYGGEVRFFVGPLTMKELAATNDAIKISNLEVDSIVTKIMSLSIEEIDELWYASGWIDSEAKADKRKSLPNFRLKKIKENKNFCEQSFIDLVTDSPYQELRTSAIFLKNLEKHVKL